MPKNYYLILGVTDHATPDEIKAAYRQQVKEYHPDRYGHDSEPFLSVQEAYCVLSDPRRRADYDQSLERARRRQFARRAQAEPFSPYTRQAEPFRAQEVVTHWSDVSLSQSFGHYSPSLEEIFDRLWGNYDLSTRPKAEHLESLHVEIPLSPDQARFGGSVRMMVPARVACQTCGGEGAVGPCECWRCAGQGAVAGEYPIEIAVPPGILSDYTAQIPLNQYGIHNFYLTVHFRVSRALFE